MSWQQTGTRYSDWIWIPFFRRCWVGYDKVEVTHPPIFGRGFLFDRTQRVVTIRRCLLGLTLSEVEIPLSEVTMHLNSEHVEGGYDGQVYSEGGTRYRIEMTTAHQGRFRILHEFGDNKRLVRILTAIERLGIKRGRDGD